MVATLVLAGAVGAAAQQPQQGQMPPQPRPAMPQIKPQDEKVYGTNEPSQAQREADRLVSLSAERIIQLLNKETGVLLVIKRQFVKMAFAQGRLLEESDLTDEALFRYIREDAGVRNMVTRELERRNYIRPKPTQDEIAAEQRRKELYAYYYGLPPDKTGTPPPAPKNVSGSQEEEYWNQQLVLGDDRYIIPRPLPKDPDAPDFIPPSRDDLIPPSMRDSRRTVNRSSVDDRDDNPYADVSPDTSRMVRVGADSLPSIVSAAASGGIGGDDDIAAAFAGGFGGRLGGSLSGGPAAPISREGAASRASGSRESASLDRRSLELERRRPLSPPNEQPLLRHLPNPYADIPSLYDLYGQVAKRQPKLERFGSEIFLNNTGNFDNLPMDVPVGPDYTLGPGDQLNVEMWGSVSQRLQRTVDREGRLPLPEVGTVLVAGRNLGEVQREVQAALRTQFRDVQVDISLARLRTVRVYVTGDVQKPGAYDINSLSTPLNALWAAGGPSNVGSLRVLRHMRGNKLVQEFDVYDVLLHGVRNDIKTFQPGDTISVAPLGALVTVEGMVRRPAIYELHNEKSLAEVLELAGGVMSTGTLRHIDVDRLDAHEKRSMLSLDIPENNNQEEVNQALRNFTVQDGDRIRISPIVPYTDKTVYLDGHVFRPGKYAFKDGMKVSDLIKAYGDLLPEPYLKHAEVIRLNAPDFAPQVISFNLGDALAHRDADIPLQAFDTVRVFGRFDFEDPPVITVTGEVREPGDHRTNGVTRVSDAVYLAGGVTPDAQLDDVQVIRRTAGNRINILSVNLRKALNGDPSANVVLEPKDRVFINRDPNRVDPPVVVVQGEVDRPGRYVLGPNMTVAEAVRLAGGLKRGADPGSADLSRYTVEGGKQVESGHRNLDLAKAMMGDPEANLPLRDGDVINVRQLGGWNDRGAFITVKGEVNHPGGYGISQGERLSSVLKRAGGFRPGAYPYGAVLLRAQVRDIQEKEHADLIRRIEAQEYTLKNLPIDPTLDYNDQHMARTAAVAQWEATLERLRTTPPAGRMVVHISGDMKRWEGSRDDIEVRAGDVLIVPKTPNFVMVSGQVYSPTAISYRPGKTAEWYVEQAGGPTQLANKKGVFVLRADGSVVGGGGGGLWSGGWSGAGLRPGDIVVVPEKAVGGPPTWRNALQTANLASSIAVAIKIASSF